MPNTPSTNYTATDTQFSVASGTGVQVDKEGHVFRVQKALEEHTHESTRGLRVPTGGIADAAVTTAKIADANVTTAKLADGSVTATKLAAGVGGADPLVVQVFS